MSILLQSLTVLRNVEAFQFVFAGYAQGYNHPNQLEQHKGGASRPDQGRRHTE
jgi:hypothetical protein